MLRSSPFEQVHRQLGARFEAYNGWNLPADFGNIKDETDAIHSHCAVVDLSSFGRIQVKGDSVKDKLNKLFSAENGTFKPDQWTWAKTEWQNQQLLCRVVRLNGDYILLTHPSQTESVCSAVESISAEPIDLTQKTAMLGLYGPSSFCSVQGLLPFDIDHLDNGDVEKVSFMMMSFTLLRGSWLSGEGMELICPAAAGPLAAGAVAKYRHKHNITPAGMESLQAAIDKSELPI
jgi:aminomethyltransferase